MAAPPTNARGAGYWNSAAGFNWVALQAVIGEVFTSVTKLSLDAAVPRPGDRVIDIGCGTGDTLLDFARVVGPSGAVLGVDISVPMLGYAEHRVKESGHANISLARADATTYAFEPRWADLVYSRFGVMFFDDPVKAFANIRSSMKVSGRLAFVCFRTMPESSWYRVPLEAARPHLPPLPPADPAAPGMFTFASEPRVQTILQSAGFRDIQIKTADVPMHGKDVEMAMTFITQVGPVSAMLAAGSEQQRKIAADAVRKALAASLGADGRGLGVGLWLVSASA